MRALREMPPFARQREIETGRYSHFAPQEKELLRSVTETDIPVLKQATASQVKLQ
jgi:hypothetical protein